MNQVTFDVYISAVTLNPADQASYSAVRTALVTQVTSFLRTAVVYFPNDCYMVGTIDPVTGHTDPNTVLMGCESLSLDNSTAIYNFLKANNDPFLTSNGWDPSSYGYPSINVPSITLVVGKDTPTSFFPPALPPSPPPPGNITTKPVKENNQIVVGGVIGVAAGIIILSFAGYSFFKPKKGAKQPQDTIGRFTDLNKDAAKNDIPTEMSPVGFDVVM